MHSVVGLTEAMSWVVISTSTTRFIAYAAGGRSREPGPVEGLGGDRAPFGATRDGHDGSQRALSCLSRRALSTWTLDPRAPKPLPPPLGPKTDRGGRSVWDRSKQSSPEGGRQAAVHVQNPLSTWSLGQHRRSARPLSMMAGKGLTGGPNS